MILEIEHIWSGIADQKFKFCYYLFPGLILCIQMSCIKT